MAFCSEVTGYFNNMSLALIVAWNKIVFIAYMLIKMIIEISIYRVYMLQSQGEIVTNPMLALDLPQ